MDLPEGFDFQEAFPLRFYPDLVLRTICDPVPEIDGEVLGFCDYMTRLMYVNQAEGIAAIQLGLDYRIIAVDCDGGSGILVDPELYVGTDRDIPYKPLSILESNNMPAQAAIEGCLSIPSVELSVPRYPDLRLKATNIDGAAVDRECVGQLARILQHEVDHLEGVLILDYQDNSEAISMVAKKRVRRFLKQQQGRR